MSDSAFHGDPRAVPLRRDLFSVSMQDDGRQSRMVVDDVSGRFAKISEHAWQRLCKRQMDPILQSQARAADWTRERIESTPKRFSLLAIRIPFGSVDPIAKRLAESSGFLFSPSAILFWGAFIALSILVMLTRTQQWFASLRMLPEYLRAADSVWIAITFLCTKVAHELAHAVMCRRMGAKSKSVGVYLFCGMPCPYCDVTDVWRVPNAARRAAVMLAGIYVELIIAALASWVWIVSNDPATRMIAMNLILVCGISTVLFNANPLMRYDGYYVLMDIVGSTNLRREARESFASTVIARIAGTEYRKLRRSDLRAVGMSMYHVASIAYRMTILLAIAAVIVHLASWIHLSVLGIGLVGFAAARLLFANLSASISVIQGKGAWMNVPKWRRTVIVSSIVTLLLLILLVPIPRYRKVTGMIDAANATSIFLPLECQVARVETEYGEHVTAGDTLALLADEPERIEITRLEGELRLARMRSELARRDALQRPEIADQWTTLQAAEEAVESLLEKAEKRMTQMRVRAVVSGVVLPPQSTTRIDGQNQGVWLASSAGRVNDSHLPYCRIAASDDRQALFLLDAKDQRSVTRGTRIRVHIDHGSDASIDTKIESISQMVEDRSSVTRDAVYQVICPLPAAQQASLLESVGRPCTGVVRLPSRSLAADLIDSLSEFARG